MKFKPFNSKVDDSKNLATMIFETLVFGLTGLVLGTFIDRQFDKLRNDKDSLTKKLALIISQVFVLGLVIYTMYRAIPGEFVQHFQITLGGLAFPAMYFGVQSSLFSAAQSLI